MLNSVPCYVEYWNTAFNIMNCCTQLNENRDSVISFSWHWRRTCLFTEIKFHWPGYPHLEPGRIWKNDWSVKIEATIDWTRGVARIFQRKRRGGGGRGRWGVTLCQSEGSHQIVMSFSPPVAGCLLTKWLTKAWGGGGGHVHRRTSPSYAPGLGKIPKQHDIKCRQVKSLQQMC